MLGIFCSVEKSLQILHDIIRFRGVVFNLLLRHQLNAASIKYESINNNRYTVWHCFGPLKKNTAAILQLFPFALPSRLLKKSHWKLNTPS